MASRSEIEWTENTWNPVTGCDKISSGCKNCYAERMAMRLKAMGSPNYQNGFGLKIHPHVLNAPLAWKKPRTIFVNSMSDLFHEKVSLEFILKVFEVMEMASHHQFQILTKRSERLAELNPFLNWPPNVWMGVSIENQDFLCRLDDLKKTGAYIKFLSLEPLLGPLKNINLRGVDWVIAGGESGPKARPVKTHWVTEIRNQCNQSKVPFFFKQWGGVNKKKAGRLLEGRIWDEMPQKLIQNVA